MSRDSESVVISVRVSRKVADTLKENRIDPSQDIKEHLSELAQSLVFRKKLRRLTVMIEKRVKPSKAGFALKSVHSDRYEMH